MFYQQISLNTIKFTEGAKSICVSLPNGFAVFGLNPLKKRISRLIEGRDYNNAVTLENTEIIIASTSQQNHITNDVLCIFDNAIGRPVMLIQCAKPIQNIFMLQNMFAFSSETEVRVYTFKPPMIFCQYRTAPNKYAPCDFIKYKEYYMVAMTGREPGMLRIIQNNPTEYFDITIPAHSHPLSVIKFNSNGSLIATASESGTLIQLFDVKSEQLIAKFRRGKLPAAIMCIAFSYESEFLAVASAKGTVHIFELSSLSAVDQNTATRAEMKIEFPGETIVAMEFMSRNMIYVAFKNGDLKQIKFNEANKTVTIEKNDSLVGMF